VARRLTQDYEANARFSFVEVPPSPALANRAAHLRRIAKTAFVQGWLAVVLFRAKRALRDAGVPILPVVCDLLNRALFNVSIGDAVEIGPGLMIPHGNVVIDGRVRIGRNCQVNPWVTIGLSNSRKLGFSADGAVIGDNVHIGTGAKVLGPVTVGDYARIGANAVVLHDVPPNSTVVGVPARVVGAPAAIPGDAPTDARLIAHMRQAIINYRLQRQSLRSLVDALLGSFEIGSPALKDTQRRIHDDLLFLDVIADSGDRQTPQLLAALDAIDTALSEAEAQPPPAS
jgi:serine O-acetyltransferase